MGKGKRLKSSNMGMVRILNYNIHEASSGKIKQSKLDVEILILMAEKWIEKLNKKDL